MGLNSRSFWKVANATQMSVIIDAEDYFRHARSAMLKARNRIMLVGWDLTHGSASFIEVVRTTSPQRSATSSIGSSSEHHHWKFFCCDGMLAHSKRSFVAPIS